MYYQHMRRVNDPRRFLQRLFVCAADRLHERADCPRCPEEQPRRDLILDGADVRMDLHLGAVPEFCCYRSLTSCRAVAAELRGVGNAVMLRSTRSNGGCRSSCAAV